VGARPVAAVGGVGIGFKAALLGLKRVFRRFFGAYTRQ
jgi:hypothetical protein